MHIHLRRDLHVAFLDSGDHGLVAYPDRFVAEGTNRVQYGYRFLAVMWAQ